jgi:hypothetical protein
MADGDRRAHAPRRRQAGQRGGARRVLIREERDRAGSEAEGARGQHHALGQAAAVELGVGPAGAVVEGEQQRERRRGDPARVGAEPRQLGERGAVVERHQPPGLAVAGGPGPAGRLGDAREVLRGDRPWQEAPGGPQAGDGAQDGLVYRRSSPAATAMIDSSMSHSTGARSSV